MYWCMDCNGLVELDRHGRCSDCGSEAVAENHGTSREYWLSLWAERTKEVA